MSRTESGENLSTFKSLQDSTKGDTEAASVPNPQPNVPDGGLQAWSCVLGGWLVSFCTFGYAQSFGVYEDLYVLSGASTSSNVAWIGSFQLFMMFAMGLPAGKLFDAGYFHHLQIAGSLLLVFSLFMLSLVDTSKYYQIFLSQGVGVGLGCGMMFLPVLSVQAHHFGRRRALAMGIVLTGSSVGGVIHPIMHNQLFHGSTGFAWGVRASAFMIMGLLVIANFLMTTRLPPKSRVAMPGISTVLKDYAYLVATLGCFCIILGLYFPYFFMQLFVDLHGMSRTLAFYTLAILNAGSVVGRTVPNMLADRFGMFNVFIPVCFACGVLVFALFGIKSTAGVVIFSLLFGAASGGFISLMPPLVSVIVPDIAALGLYLGFSFFTLSWANLVGTPIAGALLGSKFQWHRPIVFSGVMMLSGFVFITISRFMFAKRDGGRIR